MSEQKIDMAILTGAGFTEETECVDEKHGYERIAWTREDIRIVIEHESYHYALILSMYLDGKEVDVNKLFLAQDLPYRRKYEYPDKSRLERAIAYMREAVTGLLGRYKDDPEGLRSALCDALRPMPSSFGNQGAR